MTIPIKKKKIPIKKHVLTSRVYTPLYPDTQILELGSKEITMDMGQRFSYGKNHCMLFIIMKNWKKTSTWKMIFIQTMELQFSGQLAIL